MKLIQNQAADDTTPNKYWLTGYSQNIAPAHFRCQRKNYFDSQNESHQCHMGLNLDQARTRTSFNLQSSKVK